MGLQPGHPRSQVRRHRRSPRRQRTPLTDPFRRRPAHPARYPSHPPHPTDPQTAGPAAHPRPTPHRAPPPDWPTEPARRRDALALLVGFAGALRRSELAGLRISDVHVRTDHTTGEPLLVVHLPTTKTDPTGVAEQRIALPRGKHPRTCPICAFADWVRLLEVHADAGDAGARTWTTNNLAADTTIHRCHGFTGTRLSTDEDRPLFPTINRHGSISDTALSGRAVAELVKRYAARAGLDPDLFSGHSLRAGFATQAALGGASDREIMRQGRWSNPRTVHGYIRTANPLEDNAVTKLGL